MPGFAAAREKGPGIAEVAAAILRERGIRSLIVQRYFPVSYADALRGAGFFVRTAKTDFLFPGRLRKSPAEVSLIKKALYSTAWAMRIAVSIISDSEVKGSVLYRDGKPLTSEIVRSAISSYLAERGISGFEHHSGRRDSGLHAAREGLGAS